jgi:hypothetical protein
MKSRVWDIVFYSVLSVVGIGGLVMMLSTVLTINAFLPLVAPSNSNTAVQPASTTNPDSTVNTRRQPSPKKAGSRSSQQAAPKSNITKAAAPSKPAPQRSAETAEDDPRATAELDRAFLRFLEEKGLPPVDLEREREATADFSSEQKESGLTAEESSPLFTAATQALQEDFPVNDARRLDNGEVWVQIDATDAGQASMDAIMARAAELYGNASEPLKVVLWAGNRMRAVRTFNGEPMF